LAQVTSAAALLLLTALGPKPRAIGYSLVAGQCHEQVAPGATEAHSTLAVGTTARLSAVLRFSRLCGGHGNPLPCPATPLQVRAAGGLSVASVRGTEIQVEARRPGRGAIAVRARKKQFKPLAVSAAVPAALVARVSSLAIAFPELRSLRIAEGGRTALWLYPVDDGRRPLCAGGRLRTSAPALGFAGGSAWDLSGQQEVHAVGAPGWSFLEVSLGKRRLSLPVEIVPAGAIQRLVLEPHRTGSGPIRIAVRAYDDAGEVLGSSVHLWLHGDGSLLRIGSFDQPLQELDTTDAEVAIDPAHPGATMILSAQLPNGVTGRLDLEAPAR
jgi:hypothetical protein